METVVQRRLTKQDSPPHILADRDQNLPDRCRSSARSLIWNNISSSKIDELFKPKLLAQPISTLVPTNTFHEGPLPDFGLIDVDGESGAIDESIDHIFITAFFEDCYS